MERISGFEKPVGAQGLMSRGTKWMVQPGCSCSYRYGGVLLRCHIAIDILHQKNLSQALIKRFGIFLSIFPRSASGTREKTPETATVLSSQVKLLPQFLGTP